MAYNKQTWVTGEVITADKLNHMEDGIDNGGSGGEIILFYSDTNNDWHTNASYEDVKYKLTNNGVAVACITEAIDTNDMDSSNYSSNSKGFYDPRWAMMYYEPYEDDILVLVTSAEHLVWTENGITYVQQD